ncbi:hypothetical protein [Celerinatantimonas diazotrophica]|uniref:Uncharacterized protein n=1 Tax=Celerinatantimonas diazotrophica TaxID=412034 RepID=A0A4R1K4H5_9GAMM|nr:hypothetical protein [Celerinatantimonas diazotrophica]TCK59028.1 hypothetical protein EV690_1192 [Celerinatantimonas diazotrophica]CAG9297663.1 hypothetical protein CEDIAZO_02852 [Celerinatantimonas diazotrophica]
MDVIILKCRREINDTQFIISDSEIARSIGISAPAYSRDYQDSVSHVIEGLKQTATNALLNIEIVCGDIRKQYRMSVKSQEF